MASAYPLRSAIPELIGVNYQLDPVDMDEKPLLNEPVRSYVERMAAKKTGCLFCTLGY